MAIFEKYSAMPVALDYGKNLDLEYTGVRGEPVFEWQRGDRATGNKDSNVHWEPGRDTAVGKGQGLGPHSGYILLGMGSWGGGMKLCKEISI